MKNRPLKNRPLDSVEAMTCFSKLFYELSDSFAKCRSSDLAGALTHGLEMIRKFWDFDCAAVLEGPETGKGPARDYTANTPGRPETCMGHIRDCLPWVFERTAHGEFVSLSRLPEDLPENAAVDREFCFNHGLRFLFSSPLQAGEMIIGQLFLFSRRQWTVPSTELTEAFLHLGVILAGVLERMREMKRVNEFLRFEQLLSEISATYINLPIDRIEGVIRNDFGRLAELVGADRCILYMFHEDSMSFRFDIPLVWWPKRDDPVVQEHIKWMKNDPHFFDSDPYLLDRWRKGQITQFTFPEEIPAEAQKMKERIKQFGTKSYLSIPLKVGGELMGVFNIIHIHTHRTWPEDLIKRLQVFGEIFINAMVRKQSEEKLRKALSEIKHLKDKIESDYIYLKEETNIERDFSEIVGKSEALKRILVNVKQVAPTNTTVIILGETGTGKGLMARTIHNVSRRKDRPFMQINCAALAPSIIESELFGHEKGAFTGAQAKRKGRFELAHGTTLFLDEIGELPVEIQAKLLRVLEDGELERVGGSSIIKTDVRIIAATNRDLEEEVKKGRFRQDLWYRLNVFPIHIPPLRERKEDIPFFLNFFVDKYGKLIGKKFDMIPHKTIRRLQGYSWPGNVRELANMIERAVIVSHGNKLRMELPSDPDGAEGSIKTLESLERQYIQKVLESTAWRIKGPKGAASQLGLNPSTLRSRMKKLGITRPKPSS